MTQSKQKEEVRVIRNYSFWRNPIKWFRDRKKIRVLNYIVNYQWEHGLREQVREMEMDMFLYGTAFMDKDGKRVDPKKFTLPTKKGEK